MPTPQPPVKPKFISDITWMQKTLAGIAGSMFIVVLITMIPWVIDIFKPDTYLISNFRKYLALACFTLTAVVGVPQIIKLVSWLLEFYKFWMKFKELGDKDKDLKE